MSLTKVTYAMIDGASVNVLDYGAVGDGVTNDTVAIQAALDAGLGPVYFPAGIYAVTSEIVVPDNSGIIGANAFWKRRTGYTYNSEQTVFKYIGVGGVNTCVVRLSNKAVGVQGSDFAPPDTDDLVNIIARDFHIDANNLAEIGCYVYRAGNQSTLTNITAEKAKKYNHVHLGCFAAVFGTFGAYQSEEHGVAVGWDIFGWNSAEATCFAYTATFLTANNGTAGTYVPGTATDLDGSGGRFSVGRGSRVYITSEGNDGRSCLLSQLNIASGAGGTSEYYLDYLEANGDGPYIDYRDGMDGIYLIGGFVHPGNGMTLLPQNIKIEGKNNSGVVTANSGPTTATEWLVLQNIVGDLSGVGIDVSSNTYKYKVVNCTEKNTFSATTPAVVSNSDNQINAAVYFTAANPITVWKAINGTLARNSTGTYTFTFTQPMKTSGANVPIVSVVLDADTTYDTQVRLSNLSTTVAVIRVYDGAGVLTDTGDRIGFMLTGNLE